MLKFYTGFEINDVTGIVLFDNVAFLNLVKHFLVLNKLQANTNLLRHSRIHVYRGK